MPSIFFLFSTFGDWVETNLLQLIGLLVIAIGFVVWLIRLEGTVKSAQKSMEDLQKAVESQTHALNTHVHDGDAHVNHLYMNTISTRLGKLEDTISDGLKHLGEKVDRLVDKLILK